eukprot:scaffold7536_cov154-Isochrysis_galbana.AAC.1
MIGLSLTLCLRACFLTQTFAARSCCTQDTGVRKAATLTRLFPRVRTSEKKYENSVPPSRSMAPLPSGPP